MESLNLFSETEELLAQLVFIKDRINENLYQVEKEILSLINQIKESTSLMESNAHFNQLMKYLAIVDRAFTKFDFDISDRLKKFIGDFQRIDDSDTRVILWHSIRIGEYNL